MGDTNVRPPARNAERTTQQGGGLHGDRTEGDRLNDRPTRAERPRRRGDREGARPNEHCNRRTMRAGRTATVCATWADPNSKAL